jgi:outer membrane receptor protein involved in Fe transport
VTLDALASLPLSPGLSVFVRGENIANARVETALSAAAIVERATPRTLWLGLRLN